MQAFLRVKSAVEGDALGNLRRIALDGLPLLGACLVTLVYSLILFDKSMPISEGWYTEYSWLINNGEIPYRDFSYLFTPVYLLLMAGYTALFGYQIITMRVLGVIVFVALTVVTYFILRQVFSRIPSMVGAIACMLYKQSGEVEILYDYIYFVDLFAYLSVLFLLLAWKKQFSYAAVRGGRSVLQKDARLFILLCGLFSMLAFLTKQTTGAMVSIFVFCATVGFCVCRRQWKELPEMIGWGLVGAALPAIVLFAYLLVNGALGDFARSCFGSAIAAKGGLANEALRWIVEGRKSFVDSIPYVLSILLAILLLHFTPVLQAKHIRREASGKKWLTWIPVVLPGTIVLLVIGLYEWETMTRFVVSLYEGYLLRFAFFLIPTILFVWLVVRAIADCSRQTKSMRSADYLVLGIAGSVFAIGYAVGFSGGLSCSQVSLGTGLCFAALVQTAFRSRFVKPALALILCALLSLSACWVGVKYVQMYGWWGLETGSIWQQTASTDVPLLEGITMNEKDAVCYDGIYEISGEYLKNGDSVFVFPQCPILYDIVGHHSETYTKVQWFDVSSAKALQADTEKILSNPPEMMLICQVSEGAINGHESAFGAYWTGDMQETLLAFAADEYDEKASYDLGSGYIMHVFVLR